MRVAVIADIRLYREGLVGALARQGIEAAETSATSELVSWLRTLRPDVALVDIAERRSAVSLEAIVGNVPEIKVVALGVSETEEEVLSFAEAGVAGYVAREGSLEDLLQTLDSVVHGEVLCSPAIIGSLFRRLGTLALERRPAQAVDRLTARECEIVELIDEGLSNKEIAGRLHIEASTVKSHVHNVLAKLEVRHRAEAAAWARRRNRLRSASRVGS
jgi:two-component system, NarL family, nitrate/nitrite response regulator NarL